MNRVQDYSGRIAALVVIAVCVYVSALAVVDFMGLR